MAVDGDVGADDIDSVGSGVTSHGNRVALASSTRSGDRCRRSVRSYRRRLFCTLASITASGFSSASHQVRSSSLAGGAAVIEIAGREESEARSHASLEMLAAHP